MSMTINKDEDVGVQSTFRLFIKRCIPEKKEMTTIITEATKITTDYNKNHNRLEQQL
jgi:hypothetical protein